MTHPTLHPSVLATEKDRIGSVELDRFRLNAILGRSRHATDYSAEQLDIGQPAVVRVGHLGRMRGAESHAVRHYFEHQLEIAESARRHRCLPSILSSGRTRDGAPALATEFVPGKTLSEILETHAGDVSPTLFGEWFGQLARALRSLHATGAAHRNLCANEVMIAAQAGKRSAVRLLDFGVSESSGRAASRQRREHRPRYLPPEQILGTAGAPADVFALGALIWWAVAGREFLPDLQTLEDLAHARVNGAPTADPREVVSMLPQSAASLISQMLDFDPAARPTIDEFLGRWPGVVEDFPRAEPQVVAPLPGSPPPTVRTTASLLVRSPVNSAGRLVQTSRLRPPAHRRAPAPPTVQPTPKTTSRQKPVRAVLEPEVRERMLAADATTTTAEIRSFFHTAPEILAQVSDSLDGRFFSGARRAARDLEGRATSVGANRLARLCRVFSELIRESELDRLTGLAEHTSAAELHAFVGLAREMEQEHGLVRSELEDIGSQLLRTR